MSTGTGTHALCARLHSWGRGGVGVLGNKGESRFDGGAREGIVVTDGRG